MYRCIRESVGLGWLRSLSGEGEEDEVDLTGFVIHGEVSFLEQLEQVSSESESDPHVA